ncbi:MAG: nuclease-related domain-containing protein [Paenisporosarcina sp.]
MEFNIDRLKPPILQVYTRILNRLPSSHPTRKDILSQLDMTSAGYNGECQVDHYLKQISLEEPYALLKEINLKLTDHSFLSMDTLIITRKNVCILEIKTIKGALTFQEKPAQLIRDLDGVLTALPCPDQQLIRHMKRLKRWFDKNNIHLPIFGFIVLPYSKTRVVIPPKETKIIFGRDIGNVLEELDAVQPIISREKFDEIVELMNNSQTFYIPKPLMVRYPIKDEDVKYGLMCSHCYQTIKGEKFCPNCRASTRNCKKEAIEDWLYLVKNTINNRECVKFLGLKNKHAASYLLRSLNLVSEKKGKSTCYRLSKNVCF